MLVLTDLPYDTLEYIFEFFTINDIDIIKNLVLTSKTFNTPDPQNRMSLCVTRSKKIVEYIVNLFIEMGGSDKNRTFVMPRPIVYLTKYENWIYNRISNAREKLFREWSKVSFKWREMNHALVGAYIVGQYQFIYDALPVMTSIILRKRRSETYDVWITNDPDTATRIRNNFEGICIIIIKIIIHVLQLTIDGPNNSSFYLNGNMRDRCIKNLNYMLNKRYKTRTWHSLIGDPGLYESMGDDILYNKIVDVYHSEKSKLCKRHQEYISNNVFDNKDFENIKMHCDNNTLKTYKRATLLNYIKTRQSNNEKYYIGNILHNYRYKNKSEMIKFITEYIA